MNSNKGRKTDQAASEQFVNAAPDDDEISRSMAIGRPPQNIAETKAWKASKQGIGRMWHNYKLLLATTFSKMSRVDQEALVQRICVIVTIGVSGIALLLFYQFIPRLGRVFGVPAAIFGAFWVGNKIVTPVILDRISRLLNDE